MYDAQAVEALREKIGYERWLLEYLLGKEAYLRGEDTPPPTFRFQPGQPVHVAISVSDVLGAGTALEIIDRVRPLAFLASFKLLDMTFEWVLEENQGVGTYTPGKLVSRLKFVEKAQALKEPGLQWPGPLTARPFLLDYTRELFQNLIEPRNVIVHRHEFSLSEGGLTIRTDTGPVVITPDEQRALVNLVLAVVQLLTNDLQWSPLLEREIKHLLDLLSAHHTRAEFGEAEPFRVEVVAELEGVEEFALDMTELRGQLARTYPGRAPIMSLRVVGRHADGRTTEWVFPYGYAPEAERAVLREDGYSEYRVR